MTILSKDIVKTKYFKLNFGKIPAGPRNILTEIFDPLQKLTNVL